ncbi:MAG: glucose-6-phosphate isomerase [Brevundimonas sp.]|jgi:glucose-6-phosphate isomerase
MATEKTDAEKLAEAQAMMAEAAALAKAARLPSAQAAVDLLTGTKAQAFLALLKAAVEASADDLARPLGQPGAEGTKQMLQRIVTSFEGGLTAAQARVVSLQPASPADDVQPAPVTPAEA